MIAGATSSAFASISMLSLQVESTAQHTPAALAVAWPIISAMAAWSLATRRAHTSCPSAATAAAWWACLPVSIPTHT